MKALVIYYSLSGTTRLAAEVLARELGADCEAIRCGRYRSGLGAFVKGSFDSAMHRRPLIDPVERDPSKYDVVVVGGPIWASHVAPPVRTFLEQQAGGLPRMAFFLTRMGSPPEKALREMGVSARAAPIGTLALRQDDVKHGAFKSAVSDFAAALTLKMKAKANAAT